MNSSQAVRTTAAALVVVAALCGTVPERATASEFTINTCQADRTDFSTRAFEDFANRGMMWRRACNPEGPGLRGLVTANVVRAGRVVRGSRSYFMLKAPPGTQFTRFAWSGQARRHDCRYALQVWAARPNGTSVAIKNVRANRGCPNPGDTQGAGWPAAHIYNIPGTTKIFQRVLCVGGKGKPYCSSRRLNYIRTFRAQAWVADTSAPLVGIQKDTPFTRGEWVNGTQRVNYVAGDNVGVRAVRPVVAGISYSDTQRPCNYAARIPCASGPGSITVYASQLTEGTNSLVLQAADAANNLGVSAPTTVRIDHTAPGTVATAIDGGDGWRNANDFNVGWSNPVELDRAPVIASHFRLCPLGSGDCRAERRPGELTRLSHVSLPGPGEWQLRVWLEDAAGNQEPANASVPVTLRYDPEAPTVGFENPTANDPTLVSALVTDKVSGLASGQIELSAQGSGLWRTLSTRQEGNRLVARIDDATLPAGTYVVRATARDRAGNQNTSTQRLDGAPMTLQLPLRTPTALTAGVVIRRAHHRHRRGQRRFSRKSRARVALGSRVRVTGALRTRDGSPLAGADIQVLSRSTGGPERLVAVLHTDEAGRFRYVGRAVATSVLRAVYVGTATTLPAQRQVMVMVPAASTMRARPRHLWNGGVVTFVGRIRSLPVPAGGKLVEVQVILSHHWQTFRTVRTNANGVWRVRYRFRRSCGDLRYSFRARVPAESAYPFEDGHTDSVGVRVRGAPCG